MTELLALRSDLLAEVTASGVALASDRSQHVLVRPAYPVLVPLLDGTRTEAEVLEAGASSVSPARARAALRRLRLRGVVEEGRSGGSELAAPSPRVEAEEPRAGGDAPLLAEVRPDVPPGALPRVRLEVVGDVGADLWHRALRGRGIAVAKDAPTGLLLTDSYLRAAVARLVDAATGTTWLVVRPVGSEVWVGPWVGGCDGACFRCLQERLAWNHPVEHHLLDRYGSPSALHAPRPRRVAETIARVLAAGMDAPPPGSMWSLDPASAEPAPHRVPEGDCPHGTVQRSARTAPPPLEELHDRLTGVVRGLRRIDTGAAAGFHVFEASFCGRPTGPGLAELARALRRASGKGWTVDEARRSALGEAVERHCAIFRGHEVAVEAPLADLGDRAVHPASCLLFSEAQLAGRAEWNRRHRRLNRVARPFDPHRACAWSEVESVTGGGVRLLPTALLYDDFPHAGDDAPAWFDPNGTAAGPTPEEAELAGLLELIERDAIAIWWYNRVRRPGVPHRVPEVEAACRALGREHWVLDLTTDLGIPVYGAVSRRTDLPTERPLFGFGCHPDPSVALRGALLEMLQVVVQIRDAERGPVGVGVALESWLRTASVESEPFLAPAGEATPAPASPAPTLPSGGPPASEGHLASVRRAVEDAGLELLRLDLTRPDVGVPVVRTIVPGLRSFYARFAPGRLYDVPVDLGWLRAPTPKRNLHAVPFIL